MIKPVCNGFESGPIKLNPVKKNWVVQFDFNLVKGWSIWVRGNMIKHRISWKSTERFDHPSTDAWLLMNFEQNSLDFQS